MSLTPSLPTLAAMKIFRKARLVVGPHGTGLSNMVFMPSNASVHEMRPRGWTIAGFRQLAAACWSAEGGWRGGGGIEGNGTNPTY